MLDHFVKPKDIDPECGFFWLLLLLPLRGFLWGSEPLQAVPG